MSEIYSESVAHSESPEAARSRLRVLLRWPLRILIFLFCVWLAAAVLSFWIQHDRRLQQNLTTRLAAAFGRPVEVGGFDFDIWNGPVVEARSVSVEEDPRFGREYFLRADSMTLGLRWQSLFRGRLEIGTLSLTRPSLNVVRNAAGDWNITEWLPRPVISSPSNAMPGPSRPAILGLRFRRIEVTGGRINFKRGDEKLPAAFMGVTGLIDTDAPGRWRMDLDASPWRAAVVLQQTGTIHLSGQVGGISSRLRPAALDVSWTNASVSDVLRLAYGGDFGIRGTVGLLMNARTQGQDDSWAIETRTELRQLHRWDLPARADNPSVNLSAKLAWLPVRSSVDFSDVAIEAPGSHAQASAHVSWNRGEPLQKQVEPPVEFSVNSAVIDAGDLLAWVRAFHSGVADDLSVQGLAGGHAVFSTWPFRLLAADALTDGLVLSVKGLPSPAHMGAAEFRYDRGVAAFHPVTLSWGAPSSAPDASFSLEVPSKPVIKGYPSWHIVGSAKQMRDMIVAAGAFGWDISRGWDFSGPFSCDLRWPGMNFPWQAQPVGEIDFGSPSPAPAAELSAPFVNEPFTQLRAHVDLKPGLRHVTLLSGQAFGTQWTGVFDRRDVAAGWQFALSGDRLAVEDIDRWLNPRWRETLLGRMLPFLNSRASSPAAPENLRAAGHLSLDQLAVAPFTLRRFQGNLKISGRHMELAAATSQFYGGILSGSFDADAQLSPVYHANLDFSRVDLVALTTVTSNLGGLFEGAATGKLVLNAGGASREAFASSLECQGSARVTNAKLHGIDLAESMRAGAIRAGASSFPDASAAFTCGKGNIHFDDLALASPGGAIDASGSVTFTRDIDLLLRPSSATPASPVKLARRNAAARPGASTPVVQGEPPAAEAAETAHRLTGTLAAPQISPVSASPRRPR